MNQEEFFCVAMFALSVFAALLSVFFIFIFSNIFFSIFNIFCFVVQYTYAEFWFREGLTC